MTFIDPQQKKNHHYCQCVILPSTGFTNNPHWKDYLRSRKSLNLQATLNAQQRQNILISTKGVLGYYLLIKNAECPGHSCASPERKGDYQKRDEIKIKDTAVRTDRSFWSVLS